MLALYQEYDTWPLICITIFKVKLIKASGVFVQEIKSGTLNISFTNVLIKSSSIEPDTKELSCKDDSFFLK